MRIIKSDSTVVVVVVVVVVVNYNAAYMLQVELEEDGRWQQKTKKTRVQ